MIDIVEFFQDMGKFYFVGGCVRDLILGDEPHDYDLTTPVLPDDIIKYIRGKGRKAYLVGKRFGTIGVTINQQMIEITTHRSEIYDMCSRKPEVKFGKYLSQDIERRDFTLNGIACDSVGNVKDYHKGIEDLNQKVLQAIKNPKHRFKEDPLRILRGIRFASKYGMTIGQKTYQRMESCRWELLRLSKERIIDEINKMFKLKPEQIRECLEFMWSLKIFQIIMPALQMQYNYDQNSKYHDYKLHAHTIMVVEDVAKELVDDNHNACLWAELLHDVAKPNVRTLHKSGTYCNYISHELLGGEMVEQWLVAYKFSNKDRKFIVESIRCHLLDNSWLREYDNKRKKLKDIIKN